jgi:hypothetical protein
MGIHVKAGQRAAAVALGNVLLTLGYMKMTAPSSLVISARVTVRSSSVSSTAATAETLSPTASAPFFLLGAAAGTAFAFLASLLPSPADLRLVGAIYLLLCECAEVKDAVEDVI